MNCGEASMIIECQTDQNAILQEYMSMSNLLRLLTKDIPL